ncbi:MAG: hypothetical protein E4H00_07205, partial [Myxococcales bacterium]
RIHRRTSRRIDGGALHVLLDEKGAEESVHRSESFFDVVADPLRESGVRNGSRWLFASFEGYLHDVDFSEPAPKLVDRWSLFDENDRENGWRIGGVQHLALHENTGRLYSIVHRGGPGSHKDPGNDLWVYNLATKSRFQTFVAPSLVLSFIRPYMGLERTSSWFRFLAVLETWFSGPGVHSIVVTQDDDPLLFVRNSEVGALGVMDATSGEILREVEEIGISGSNLGVP